VERLNLLINDLLDITKMKNGNLQFDMEEVDTEKLFPSTIKTMRDIYPKHDITYINNASAIIYGNSLRLEQVLINIINNAVKYSVNNNRIQVETKITGEGRFYCGVRDWGIGIPEEKQKDIFNKFYRVKDAGSYAQGLGVGLYICFEILKLHDAELMVESKPGEGSLFYFTIPVLRSK
jgi:two-component system, sensor histidine kinase and response regulator